MSQIILASQSPRRKNLLGQMGVLFDTIPSDFDEQLDDTRSPEEVAKELGLGKAMTVAQKYPDAYVIGSDTIVSVDGRQLGKARDDNEARSMLKLLAGKSNTVTSSVVLICKNKDIQLVGSENATVLFKPYDNEAVEAYIQTRDWADKAGAYGIQSGAAVLIDHISGDYDVILGLPTKLLSAFLAEVGVDAKQLQLQSPVPVV